MYVGVHTQLRPGGRRRRRATFPTPTYSSMCATAQTESARPMQNLIIDLWTQGYRMPPMKHALQLEVSKVMPSYPVRRNSGARTAKRDLARIQGGNWSMQTFRRSGHVYDEGECQMSIDEFMAERGLQLDRDDA